MTQKFKEKILQLLKSNATPREIALGLAIGVFVGLSPLVGLHAVLGVAFAFIFRANKLAALVGTQVSTPWALPFLIFLNLQIGTFFTTGKWQLPYWNILSFQSFKDNLLAFAIGTLILGGSGAVITYYLSLKAVQKLSQRLKKEK